MGRTLQVPAPGMLSMHCWLPEKANGATGFTIRIFTLTKTSSLGAIRGLQIQGVPKWKTQPTPFVLPHNSSISPSSLPKMYARPGTAQSCFLLLCYVSHLSLLAYGDSQSIIQGAGPWFLGSPTLLTDSFTHFDSYFWRETLFTLLLLISSFCHTILPKFSKLTRSNL